MTRRGSYVLFSALLLVVQLLFGVMAAGAMSHDGAQHCAACPTTHASGMSHAMGSGTDDCGSHCSDDGSTGAGHSGCGSGCAMIGSGHCGSSVNPAVLPSMSFYPIVLSGDYARDRQSVDLPDSPLFDLLRPPTRG